MLACTQAQDRGQEYVGFATLPNQLHRKSVKKGFDFTLMVAGESGLGKSTLIDSLFLTDLYKERTLPDAQERVTKTLKITRHGVEIEERGVRVKLTVVDTPGFGDAIDNSDCWKPIVAYIDEQFEQFFQDESGLNRKNIQDNRVHCLLYFLSPLGHGEDQRTLFHRLRPLDIKFMKAVHEKVNIIPVIAKADALTPSEVQRAKQKIREEIQEHGIEVYRFPETDSDEEEEFKRLYNELMDSIPFAVIGSRSMVETKGKQVRGRFYPWGVAEVENAHHCDFDKLRTVLIQTHLHDLKEVTQDVHYENYRAHCLQRQGAEPERAPGSRTNRESESGLSMDTLPVSETAKLIEEKERELRQMQEMLQKMQQQMQQNPGEQSDPL
ncbi:septin-5-like isoform X2 [Narcine bancroftii]|uniref:septin-5-like isoform X2 n=1 Tax=Narcine bancroftii TaxID=1343680 RepID=UPI0038322661